jgi:hypothetical protein
MGYLHSVSLTCALRLALQSRDAKKGQAGEEVCMCVASVTDCSCDMVLLTCHQCELNRMGASALSIFDGMLS